MQVRALHDTAVRRYEPKSLRLRLFARRRTAGSRRGRRLRPCIAVHWPWVTHLTTAITQFQALPAPT
jgi:hypothetical protein